MPSHSHIYRIDCSDLLPEEYEAIYTACDKLAFMCTVVPGCLRCFEVTWTDAKPLKECVSLPEKCLVQEIL